MRAALYARVSSELQEKEETIRSQLEALCCYAAEKKYQVVAEYIDEEYNNTILS